MNRRLIPVLWMALGVALILAIIAFSQSTSTTPVSQRVPGQGRMQPFQAVQPRSSTR